MTLLVLFAGLAIAACGSSNSSSPSSSSSASSSGAAPSGSTTASGAGPGGRAGGFFSSLTTTQKACLKSHGVTLPTGAGRFRPGAGHGTLTAPTTGGAVPSGGTSTTGGFPGGGSGHGGFGGAGGFGAGRSSKFATAFSDCGIKFSGHARGGFGAGAGGAGAGARPTAAALKTFVACVDKNGYDLKDSQLNTSGHGSILPKSLETDTAFTKAAQPCARDLFSGGAPPSGAAGGTS